jgi:hypothetical protein
MTTHRFVVNVPNPTRSGASVELSLERGDLASLGQPGLDVPEAELEIAAASISLEPCDEGRGKLGVRLKPFTSIDVYVTATTADPPDPNIGGAAVLHLVDRRFGKIAGGVMLVCLDGPHAETPGQLVTTRGTCPAELADLYFSDHETDPTKRRSRTIPANDERTLVAAITNPTSRSLTDMTIYLEHLGSSGAVFTPQAWNAGSLQPSDTFYATWTVGSHGALPGSFEASIVVDSKNRLPVRLHGQLKVEGREARAKSKSRRKKTVRR